MVALIVTGCTTPFKKIKITSQKNNLAEIYNPGSTRLHPAYTVYHESDQMTTLYIKIFTTEILYSPVENTSKMMGNVELYLDFREITDRRKPILVDSVTYNFQIPKDTDEKPFLTQVPLPADTGKIYELKIVTTDKIRNQKNIKYFIIDKKSRFSQQNFKISNAQGIPLFWPYIVGNNLFRVKHRINTYDTLFIKYFKNDLPLPQPTFSPASEDKYYQNPDSIFVLPFDNTRLYQMNYEGMYFIQLDTTLEEGLSVFNYGENFPKVSSPIELAEPLAYLTTSVQYKSILESTNLKFAVDNFWLECGGNLEKARGLLRIYYNRVYFANYYFTANKPGWKTDRGMIYVVYGAPQRLEREPGSEQWTYYRKNSGSSITFSFVYYPSPYSVDNFVLQRSDSHDWHWREAVDGWNNGQVFLFE